MFVDIIHVQMLSRRASWKARLTWEELCGEEPKASSSSRPLQNMTDEERSTELSKESAAGLKPESAYRESIIHQCCGGQDDA